MPTDLSLQLRLARRRVALALSQVLPVGMLLVLRRAYLDRHSSWLLRSCIRPVLELARLRGVPYNSPFLVAQSGDSTADSGGMWMLSADSYLGNRLYWFGSDAYEAGEQAWWADLVRCHKSVLEIGANVGIYSMVGGSASTVARYRAVEANPVSADTLRRNLALNELGHVDVIEAAVVGHRGATEVALTFPDLDPYATSLGAFVDGSMGMDGPGSCSVTVPAIPIRDLVEGVDLIKLDIEGLELEVLSSIGQWIASTMPTLVVEVLDRSSQLRAFLAEVIADIGYQPYVVTRRGITGLSRDSFREVRLEKQFGTRDVTLLVPARAQQVFGTASSDSRTVLQRPL